MLIVPKKFISALKSVKGIAFMVESMVECLWTSICFLIYIPFAWIRGLLNTLHSSLLKAALSVAVLCIKCPSVIMGSIACINTALTLAQPLPPSGSDHVFISRALRSEVNDQL